MNTYVVWTEMDRAKIFKVRAEGPEIHALRRREVRHHTNNEPDKLKNCDKFFKELQEEIEDGDEILLMGPGLAKDHFRQYLEKHNELLARSIVGSLTLDLETDAQLLAHSRNFFREYDVFGQSITS